MRAYLLHPVVMLLLGGAIVGGAMFHREYREDASRQGDGTAPTFVADEQREREDEWSLVSPLLTCGVDSTEPSTRQVIDTRDSVQGIIDAARTEGKITDAGVYVRLLNDGGWFGIDERTRFTPGSLLKVPLALSLMRAAERDPSFGVGNYTYDEEVPNIATAFPPTKYVEKGKGYTFPELLELSLAYSDNIATLMLAQLIDRAALDEAYSDLGIEVPGSGDSYTTSVRTYASFFRILYNGTYLSHRSSQYVLALLAQSSFTEGIVAGVPEGVVVAHKFGERENGSELSQLHDCGIVYTEQPYVLCVMLRGDTMGELPDIIADISQAVYEGVGRQ